MKKKRNYNNEINEYIMKEILYGDDDDNPPELEKHKKKIGDFSKVLKFSVEEKVRIEEDKRKKELEKVEETKLKTKISESLKVFKFSVEERVAEDVRQKAEKETEEDEYYYDTYVTEEEDEDPEGEVEDEYVDEVTEEEDEDPEGEDENEYVVVNEDEVEDDIENKDLISINKGIKNVSVFNIKRFMTFLTLSFLMFIIKKTGDEEYSTTRGTNTDKIIIPQNITNTYNELTTNFLSQQNPTLENKQNIPKSTYNLLTDVSITTDVNTTTDELKLFGPKNIKKPINQTNPITYTYNLDTIDTNVNTKSTQRNPDSSLAYKFAEWYLNNIMFYYDGNNDMTSRNKIQVIQNQLNKIIEKLPLNVNDAVKNEFFVNNYLKMKWYNKTNIKCNKKQSELGTLNFEMFVLQFFEPVFNELFNDLKRVQNFNTYFKTVKTTFEEKINEIITILFNYKYCLDKENFEVITDGKRKNNRFRK